MNKSFDVFLSHNSKDKPAVRELAEALRARGLKPWLDEWELVPGHPWQEAIEEIIETTRSSAVLIGKDGLGPWQDAEMRGCLSEFVDRKLPVIPVLLPGAPELPELPFFLKRFTWVDLRNGLTDEGLDRLQWGATGKRPHRLEFSIPSTALKTTVATAETQPASAALRKTRTLLGVPAWIALLSLLGTAALLLDHHFPRFPEMTQQTPAPVPPVQGGEEVDTDRPVQDKGSVKPSSGNRQSPTVEPRTELVGLLEFRASRIVSILDAEKEEALSSIHSGRGRVGAGTKKNKEDFVRQLVATKALFVELHRKHIEAIRQKNWVTAHEIATDIHYLMWSHSKDIFWGAFSNPGSAYSIGGFETHAEVYPGELPDEFVTGMPAEALDLWQGGDPHIGRLDLLRLERIEEQLEARTESQIPTVLREPLRH